jgi:hypothetical protein
MRLLRVGWWGVRFYAAIFDGKVYGVGDSKELANRDLERNFDVYGVNKNGAIIFAEISIDQAKRIANADGPLAWPLEVA